MEKLERIDQCCLCGRLGKRYCPALEKQICPSCCGSKRGSQISCASDCVHYPFSVKGYDLWLKVDGILQKKVISYVTSQYGREKFLDLVERMRISDRDVEQENLTAVGIALHYALFIECDQQGKTLAKEWEAQGWSGLNNDEQVMMHYRTSTKATIIEAQKILDYQAMECIDLLNPEPKKFLLFDRHTAAKVVRFQQLLIWLTHYPHFSRVCNGGVEVSDWIQTEFLKEVQEDFAQERKRDTQLTIYQYLAENFSAYCRRIQEMLQERWQATLHAMDLYHCVAIYDILIAREEIKAILDQYPDFRWEDQEPKEEDPPETLYYSWLRLGESKAIEKEMASVFRYDAKKGDIGTIGNIRLYPNRLFVETLTKQKFEFAKKMIQRYLGEKVRLRSEKVVDLAKQLAERNEEGFESDTTRPQRGISDSIPPNVQEKATADFYKNHYEKFLEDAIPALDGANPRQSAADPKLRPKLIELMKGHVRRMDRLNQSRSLPIQIDWVLDELGLEELK